MDDELRSQTADFLLALVAESLGAATSPVKL
jgi:hypothetical protein